MHRPSQLAHGVKKWWPLRKPGQNSCLWAQDRCRGLRLASHFDTVASRGTGTGLCPLNLGLTAPDSANEIFVWLRDCFSSRDCQLEHDPVPAEPPRVTPVMAQAAQSVSVPVNAMCQPSVCLVLKSCPDFCTPCYYLIRASKDLFVFGC